VVTRIPQRAFIMVVRMRRLAITYALRFVRQR